MKHLYDDTDELLNFLTASGQQRAKEFDLKGVAQFRSLLKTKPLLFFEA
jgi:hypothetical protein